MAGIYDNQINKLMQAQKACESPSMYIPPSKRQQLEQQRKQIQSGLDRIDAALAALDKHPELEKFIDVMQQAGV